MQGGPKGIQRAIIAFFFQQTPAQNVKIFRALFIFQKSLLNYPLCLV